VSSIPEAHWLDGAVVMRAHCEMAMQPTGQQPSSEYPGTREPTHVGGSKVQEPLHRPLRSPSQLALAPLAQRSKCDAQQMLAQGWSEVKTRWQEVTRAQLA
jgi:hypothetical protein